MRKRPNKHKIEITKEGLIKAAANIAAVTPPVLQTAKEIIRVIGPFIENIAPN